VANPPEDLEKAINYIHREFAQPALIEEYLPGEEYTVMMLSNGKNQEFLPGVIKVDECHFGKYPNGIQTYWYFRPKFPKCI
jgi:D-alanine-D-alanine ligase